MPIKLGLVITKRPQPTIVAPRQLNYKAHTASQQASQQASQASAPVEQYTGLSLKRVMNAPKTGCKSCGG
uniref:Uncharacterized protein n=1 Tax=viral metagenome TaxID=1070528 RepID=A0A6C0IM04_9ZZZZ